MTIENPSGSAAGTDYRPAPVKPVEPLTSSYVESERTRDQSNDRTKNGNDTQSNDTTSGATGDGTDKTAKPLSAQGFSETLLGQSKVQWGKGSTGDYPGELDLSGDAVKDPFADKFNSLKGGAKNEKSVSDDPFASEYNELKPAADKQAGGKQTGDGTAPDKTGGGTAPDGNATDTQSGQGDAPKKDGEKGASAVSDFLGKALDPTKVVNEIGSLLSGGKVDKEAAKIVGEAQRGKEHLDAQDSQYLKQWRGPTDNGNVAPPGKDDDPAKYTHKNEDGSSYNVTDGKITGFTTKPSKENPEGLTYSNIHYDKNNQIDSYETAFGQKHTRTSEPNANGFANWKSTTLDGKPSPYGGANSNTWMGKPAVDDKGFHNLIGNGTYGGYMFSREMDGTHVMTRPSYANGKMTGMETTSTLPDKTEVSRKSTFDKAGKLQQDNSNVKVKEGDGPKTSHVQFDEAGKATVKEQPKPVGDASGGENAMGFFADALAPGGTDQLKDFKELNIQRNGKNNFHISGDMNNVFMPPPNVTVGGFGPLGRVSATPQGGRVNNFSLDLKFDNNSVHASNVTGMEGSASLSRTGMFGRTRNIGSTHTSTTGADWDMQNNTLLAKSDRSNTLLDKNNFAPDSMTGKLLSDEKAEDTARKTLKGLEDHLNSAHLKQTSPGVFEGSLDLKENQIALDTKMPGVKTNLYMDDKIDFTKTKDGINFKKGEVQLGVQIGNNEEGRRDVSRISRGTGENGEPVLKVQFHGGGADLNVPIPAKPGQPAASDTKPQTPAQPHPRDARPPAVAKPTQPAGDARPQTGQPVPPVRDTNPQPGARSVHPTGDVRPQPAQPVPPARDLNPEPAPARTDTPVQKPAEQPGASDRPNAEQKPAAQKLEQKAQPHNNNNDFGGRRLFHRGRRGR